MGKRTKDKTRKIDSRFIFQENSAKNDCRSGVQGKLVVMNKLAVIDKAKLAIIRDSFGKDGLPLPFVKEIFLIQCHVAGTSYRNLEDVACYLTKPTFG